MRHKKKKLLKDIRVRIQIAFKRKNTSLHAVCISEGIDPGNATRALRGDNGCSMVIRQKLINASKKTLNKV